MKLAVQGLDNPDVAGRVTHALLALDIGARINVDLATQAVRVEGRMSLPDAMKAIARGGCRVATVLDATISDAVSPSRHARAKAWG
jgi:hypothetical protein